MAKQTNRRVGLMGGTFDPIHYGHLYIAECSRIKFGLDKVLFIPAGQPVHKKMRVVQDPGHRLEMTRLAIQSNPYFEISSIEINRPGPSYTVDTLEQLHKDNNSAEEYFFITGVDAILEILTWKNVTKVFELSRFIAVTRPGYSFGIMNKVLEKLTKGRRERIHFHETSGILTSSTELRQRVINGDPIKYLLPENVEQYIKDNKLYGSI